MKFAAVLLIFCGITVAYDAESECKRANIAIGNTIQTTNTNAAAANLWRIRKFGDMLVTRHLKDQPDLKKIVTEEETKIGYAVIADRMLGIFDKSIDPNKAAMMLSAFNFCDHLAGSVDFASRSFLNTIQEGQRSNTIDQSILAKNAKLVHSEFNRVVTQFYSLSPNYKSKAVESINKLKSKLDGILESLKKTDFGQSITPFVEKIKRL